VEKPRFDIAEQVRLFGADSLLPPKPKKYVNSGARISADGKYRYLLWREWRGTHDPKNWRWLGGKDGAGEPLGEPKSVLFVMLNPSTADGSADDPTIRRCVGFARAWKFERIEVVNLFAYRATKPRDLFALEAAGGDPIGWENSGIVDSAARDAGLVVCAWGGHGGFGGQDQTMRGWLGSKPQYALGFTKDGHPRHPLFAPLASPLVRMPD
jgi:hypothetical protein